VSDSGGRMAQWFLRYATPFAGVRRWPVIGPAVRWLSARMVPRDALAWMQVQRGPAAGIWLHLNPRTGRLAFEGGGEPEVQAALVKHLRPGMTFYDVGANIGFFSLLGARLVGASGRVIAFEADPEVAARLREHVARNEFPWISVEQKAVWSEGRSVFFERIDPGKSPDRGLGRVVESGSGDAIRVEAVSLDDFVKGAAAPDFVKCDVEGAEVEVFCGMERLLREKRPAILCEMHSEENKRVLRAQFARLDYQSRLLDENHVLALPR
jgi:FkbM family methyltransferase